MDGSSENNEFIECHDFRLRNFTTDRVLKNTKRMCISVAFLQTISVEKLKKMSELNDITTFRNDEGLNLLESYVQRKLRPQSLFLFNLNFEITLKLFEIAANNFDKVLFEYSLNKCFGLKNLDNAIAILVRTCGTLSNTCYRQNNIFSLVLRCYNFAKNRLKFFKDLLVFHLVQSQNVATTTEITAFIFQTT